MLKTTLMIIGALVSVFLIFIIYSIVPVISKKAVVQEKNLGPYYFVYTEYKGPYSKIQKTFGSVITAMYEAQLFYDNIAGIYFNDPKKDKNAAEHRAMVGVFVSEADFNSKAYPASLQKVELEKKSYVVVDYATDFKNPIRYFMSIGKAYGNITAHITKNGYIVVGPPMEIYPSRMPPKKGDITTYALPIKKRSDK